MIAFIWLNNLERFHLLFIWIYLRSKILLWLRFVITINWHDDPLTWVQAIPISRSGSFAAQVGIIYGRGSFAVLSGDRLGYCTNQLTLERTSPPFPRPLPSEVFWSFFQDNETSASNVFRSCSFIPRAHFETSLLMVSHYGYECEERIYCYSVILLSPVKIWKANVEIIYS